MINCALDWVSDSLALLGVRSGDVLCIHGDAGVAAQIRSVGNESSLQQLFDAIEAYLGINGTLVIPSFTYSATKNLIYDPTSTPSEVGMFSEAFRQRTNVSRSLNTIFSVCSSGKFAKDFQNSRVDDCFGLGTAFDLLYKSNALILTLGFDIKKGVTFTHYVEQRLQVPYRYMKDFVGSIRYENGKIHNQHITYYVRDQSFPSTCNLEYFGKRARVAGRLVEAPFGRFPATSIRAQDFFDVAKLLLHEDIFSLLTCFQQN